jgi:hypothetical protein
MLATCLFLLGIEPLPAADKLEYNREIRPILAENCFRCHGPDSGSRKADLRLDKRDVAIELASLQKANSSPESLPPTPNR